jgi:uncharacterized protein YegL
VPDLDNIPGNADDGLLTLAFYVLADVSASMTQFGAIDAVNNLLPKVIDAIINNSMLADVVRLGMIDFSDDARVQLGLGDLRNVKHVPTFTTRGGTSFAAAFRALRQEIDRDVKQLKEDGFKVYRPAVFFITDGTPTDDSATLQAAFGELTDPAFKARPNIIPFGVGDATKDAVDPWVFPKAGQSPKPMRSYVARPGVDPAKAINEVAEILISSVLASAQSVTSAGSGGGFVPPDDEDFDDDDWIV